MLDSAKIIKCYLELAYNEFKPLSWHEKKLIFETDVIQTKLYEIPKVIAQLDKFIAKQEALDKIIEDCEKEAR